MIPKIVKLKKIKTQKGHILKFVDKDFKYFKKFGEIYFNEVKKNKKSDWIFHRKNQCLMSVINGKIKFEIKFKNKKKQIILSRKILRLLIIPKKIWFRFQALQDNSILANFINNRHADNEVIKKSDK
jgi:hypothetical protein